jgi:photosystem II stability/assembly factor-like uncharacterized protein
MEWERVSSLPGLITQWSMTSDPNSGDIIAYHDDFKTELYFSNDNGDNWIKGPLVHPNYLLKVNPFNGQLFAISACGRGGLVRSMDGGKNWKTVLNENIYYFFILPSGEIYASGNDEDESELDEDDSIINFCWYSNDNGDTWIEKSNEIGSNFSIEDIGKDGTLYAKSQNGIYRSTNGGSNWLESKNCENEFIKGIIVCDDFIIAALNGNETILKSADKGITWIGGNKLPKYASEIVYNSFTKDIFATCYIDKFKTARIDYYKSSDLGNSWELINDGLDELTSQCERLGELCVNNNTGKVFISSYELVYRLKNYPA